ncbi:hypothetical protein [Streptomyces sp. NPDC058953]|uniref:hypothetical protein n=1 Tax=unclassified Streptomyces TaxID=2593676 RepID=UPI00368EB584
MDDLAFGIFDNGEIPIETANWSTPLIAVMSAGAIIRTAIHTGYVCVGVDRRPGRPDKDGTSWEGIVEGNIHSRCGNLRVDSFQEGHPAGLPLLSTAGPGWYRIRVYARGRATAPGAVRNEPTEHYLLRIWPAPPSPSTILRKSTSIGRWHDKLTAAAPESVGPAMVPDPSRDRQNPPADAARTRPRTSWFVVYPVLCGFVPTLWWAGRLYASPVASTLPTSCRVAGRFRCAGRRTGLRGIVAW